MHRLSRTTPATAAVLLLLPLLLAGCRVERSESGSGEHVQVSTPFAAAEIKTDRKAAETTIGLPIYPGSTLDTKSDGKSNGAADVNLSLGNLRIRVKALGYRSTDAPASLRAFYTRELGRFGTVLTCQDHHPVGTPTRTPEGLTCSDQSGQTDVDADSAGFELKTGSPEHQHLVTIEPDGAGTRFALVLLDLPRSLAAGHDDATH